TQAQLDVFTAIPVPILIREQLDQDLKFQCKMGVIDLKNIHFYVLFNDELLDETSLSQLLLIKENEIDTLNQELQTQQRYLDTYQEKLSIVKYQKLSKQTFETCQNQLTKQLTTQATFEEQIVSLTKEKEEAAHKRSSLATELLSLNDKLITKEQKLQDLMTFMRAYEVYIDQLKQLHEYVDAISACEEEIEHLEETVTRLNQEYDALKDHQREIKSQLDDTKKSLIKFSHYELGTEISKDIEDLLAEYQAITNKMSDNIKRCEQDLEDAKVRFETEEKNLEILVKRYNLIDADYQSLMYDEYAEEKIISEIDERNRLVESQKQTISELSQAITVNGVHKENKYKEMKSTIHEVEILPKNQVVKRDFSTLLAHVKQEENQILKQLKVVNECLSVCKRERSGLIEYEHLNIEPLTQVDSKYYEYSETKWREERQLLLRDYKAIEKDIQKLKNQITDEINRLWREPLFEDDFFKQPLKRLEHSKHIASAFLEQYQVIHQVFESMVKKLAVDIEYSEKEKANVVGLLLDYVGEVHKNLGMIDQNSSIHIRGKNIKMLRIKLPNWEEAQSVYVVRMHDFVDQVTTTCLELLNQNQNIEEFIGHQVTTKHLYDRIVGTSNVEIKLYKIEEQREYQISWEQVAKNSGGEGFLSAFVILSSLLSFMRREETDLFLSHEQGKVLIMDNPFAQTNAAHLLKPLFELAKKNNTQLICLSGLGGESIYSRFENIYSLSLVPSSFKKGSEYLKSNHVKGQTDQQLMIPSRIYVEEAHQETLLF
ncbi:MAG TPA: hypothetical protein DCY20_09540, partial [Firmicutes bacterium]|nr:hypothetical protein [Bacillota bacterium]